MPSEAALAVERPTTEGYQTARRRLTEPSMRCSMG